MGRGLVPAVVSLALVLPLSPSVSWAAPAPAASPPAEAPADAPADASPTKKKSKKKKSKKKKGKSKTKDESSTPTPTEPAKASGGDGGASPSAAPSKSKAKPEPAANAPLEALPLELSGKLSKDSRKGLEKRFASAMAGETVASGSYKVRLSVKLSGKRNYALTLVALGSDDAVALELHESCDGCSLDQVGERMQALVQQAVTALDEPKAPVPGSVAVRSTPPGAAVRVDGAEHGVTPQVIELPAGEHTIAVDKPGFAPHEQKVVVEEGAELPVEVTLKAATPTPAVGPTPDEGKDEGKDSAPTGPDPGRGLKIGGAVVLSAGLAGVAAGVAMILIDEKGVAGCSGDDVDFRGECRDRYDTLLGGIIGTAAGGLGVAGGLAMLIHGQRVTVRARGGKQQASVSVSVRF